LQNAGLQPICVVGGATGLIGDPRKSGERVLNDKEIVESWAERLKFQIKRFLKFDSCDNAAKIVNNYDWTANISAIDFLREIGKNFRMGAMLAKEMVSNRLKSDEGLSYTEFSYQVLQGYDYYVLNKNENVVLQTGGQDQWGNLMSGVDLIRRLTGENVHVMTTPLITDSNGNKFGKSEGGAIWLDANMMSPYKFYQFWLNVDDKEVIKLLKIFTFLSRKEIDNLAKDVEQNPGARVAQKKLAEEVTKFVHGEEALDQAIKASGALFGRGDLAELSAETLAGAVNGLEVAELKIGDKIGQAFIDTKLETSFGNYRKTLQSGGIYLNNQKVDDLNRLIQEEDILAQNIILLRKGKKNLAAIKVVS
jgi:tyrosyl-tRNA synthetase